LETYGKFLLNSIWVLFNQMIKIEDEKVCPNA